MVYLAPSGEMILTLSPGYTPSERARDAPRMTPQGVSFQSARQPGSYLVR